MIVLVGLIVFTVVLSVLAAVLECIEISRARSVFNKYEGRNILRVSSDADLFGQTSRGISQTRGNGVLVLTDKELYYETWMPEASIEISREKIVEVELTKSFMGKTRLFPLLKVGFINNSGNRDSIAWSLKNAAQWEQEIKGRMHDEIIDLAGEPDVKVA